MSQIAGIYAEAIYSLAQEEQKTSEYLSELSVLQKSFRENPEFVRLLASPNIPKDQRIAILDDSFSGKMDPFVLNFLKLLTEKGYISQFDRCCEAYRSHYNRDMGIVPVTAVTAVPLTEVQKTRLQEKMANMLEKKIELSNRVDPSCLGGIRLDFDGKQLDDTVSHRLKAMSELLGSTVL